MLCHRLLVENATKSSRLWVAFNHGPCACSPPAPRSYPLTQAESREHRRWIDRINSKLREKGKKEEFRRVRDFVEYAYRQDPR